MTYPKCDKCAHPWHGLPCPAHTTPPIGTPRTPGPCGCPSPFDDNYWNEDAS